MFYSTDTHHGLKHNPFNAIVVPRPIGWISTIDPDGNPNLAPYSFFNGCAYEPPQVMFAATGPHLHGGFKDTVANIEATGEFVVNLATWELRNAMNASAANAAPGVDEFRLAGLDAQPAQLVKPPRVKASPVHLECTYTQKVTLPSVNRETPNTVVFGQVIGIHIDDAIIVDGLIDYTRMQPIGRLGYMDYTQVTDVFEMLRPE